jgi:hypothetical protein
MLVALGLDAQLSELLVEGAADRIGIHTRILDPLVVMSLYLFNCDQERSDASDGLGVPIEYVVCEGRGYLVKVGGSPLDM